MDHSSEELQFLEKIQTSAQSILTQKFGEGSFAIDQFYRKFTFSGTFQANDIEKKVIVKSWIIGLTEDNEPDVEEWFTRAYPKSIANYHFLAQYTPELIPKLHGYDRDNYLIVTEFNEGTGLHEYLQLNEKLFSQASKMLHKYMVTLARLHASTLGKLDEYVGLVKEYGWTDRNTLPMWTFGHAKDDWANQIKTMIENVNVELEQDFYDTIANLFGELQNSKYISFIHGDPCPDNLLVTDKQMMLIDLDTCDFFNAFLDTSYIEILFPSCWCVGKLPQDLTENLRKTYITEFNRFHPLSREEYDIWSTKASLIWMLNSLRDVLPKSRLEQIQVTHENQPKWGTSTLMARVRTRINTISSQTIPQELEIVRNGLKTILIFLEKTIDDPSELEFFHAFQSTDN